MEVGRERLFVREQRLVTKDAERNVILDANLNTVSIEVINYNEKARMSQLTHAGFFIYLLVSALVLLPATMAVVAVALDLTAA